MTNLSKLDSEFYAKWDGKYSYAPAFRFSREILCGRSVGDPFIEALLRADSRVLNSTNIYHHQFSNFAFLYTLRKNRSVNAALEHLDLASQRKARTTNWKLLGLINSAFLDNKKKTNEIEALLATFQENSGFIWDSRCSASAQYHVFMTAILLLYYLEFQDVALLERLKKAINFCCNFSLSNCYVLFGRGSEQNFGYSALNFIFSVSRFSLANKDMFRKSFLADYKLRSESGSLSIYKFCEFEFDGYGYNSVADYHEIELWWNVVLLKYEDTIYIADGFDSSDNPLFIKVKAGRVFAKIRHYHPLEDVLNAFLTDDGKNYVQFNEEDMDTPSHRLVTFKVAFFFTLILRFKLALDILTKSDSGLNRRHRLKSILSKKTFNMFEIMLDKDLADQDQNIKLETIFGLLGVNPCPNGWRLVFFKSNFWGRLANVRECG